MSLTPITKKRELPPRVVIPTLERLTAPGKLVFLAIHTRDMVVSGTQYKRVLVCGHAKYWRRERRKVKEIVEDFEFSNTFDFFQWVTGKINKRETLYLYCHDASTEFLAMDGFRQLPDLDFVLASIYHKFTTTIMRFECGTRRLVILDTQNYYPVAVEQLALSFGVNLPIKPKGEEVTQDVKDYCRAKAGLLNLVLTVLVRETVEAERGSLKMTSSSTSHSIFRASFMKHKIVTNHIPEVVAFEQSAYFGGYTGLSRLVEPGRPDLFHLDVNSMYPSVMLDKKFPIRLVEFASGLSLRNLERFLNGYLVTARVTLHANDAIYPMREQGLNFYPIGDFDVTLNTASLKWALEHDAIESVHQAAVYMGAPIFREFVEDTYKRRMNAREQGNAAHELFYKTINNTLYGKFGQSRTETVRVADAPIDEFQIMEAFDAATGENWQEMHAGGSVLFIYKRGESEYTSFAIAGHVTDYARMKLFELKRIAGSENVFYMDTDSLFANAEGVRRLAHLINPVEMGALKMVDQASFFVGFAKKDYVFGDIRKLKGFDSQGRRMEGNVMQGIEKASVWGAVRHRLSGGAFWKEVNKYYRPFLVNERMEHDGSVTPLRFPDDAEWIGVRKYTMKRVTELCKIMLPVGQRRLVGEWLGR